MRLAIPEFFPDIYLQIAYKYMRALVLITVAALQCLPCAHGLLAADSATLPSLSSTELTNAAQIRKLTSAEAAQAIPVRLCGVVVDESQPREHAVILADQTASLYLFAVTNLFARYHPRDLLAITGVTSKGEFAPCVLVTAVAAQELGSSVIPAPRPTSYQELIRGSLDAQFVEITGVVRQILPAEKGDETWRILLEANGGLIPIRIPLPQDLQIQEDAEVTVQAICLYQFNKKRQALNPVLQVPHGRSVRVVKPSPTAPFDSPLQPLDSLLQFSSDKPFGHRIHVHGVVTLARPDSLLWIHDASSGLRIQMHHTDDLQPGEEIDVLGFSAYGASTPMLEDAIYKKTGTVLPTIPLMISDPTNANDHQDDLIGMEATLTDIQPVLDGLVLTLEHNATTFKAILKFPLHPNTEPLWQAGSVVRVVGICDVVYDYSKPVMGVWHPQSFQLLLRSPADLIVIQAPSWWTAHHIIFVLSWFLGTVIIISSMIVWQARRRLREQAHNRKMAEAEFSAVLAERNRLAREIHDTLAQGFTATLLQLQLVRFNAANDPKSISSHLDKAEKMIRASLKEARNSIWQMHPQVLETGDLVSALKNVLKQLSEGIVPKTSFGVVGRERRLSPIIESNVLRLGQEAITNAVKHAGAKEIKVTLDFSENELSLTVADDGCGFDPTMPPPSEGGFGLLGMHERAKQLHGHLKVQSAPTQGTQIILRIPLAEEPPFTRTGG